MKATFFGFNFKYTSQGWSLQVGWFWISLLVFCLVKACL